MITEITSKSELLSLAEQLNTETTNLKSALESMSATLNGIPSYDGIEPSIAANTLITNLSSIATDAEVAAKNIKSYANEINVFDVNDLTSETEEEITPTEPEVMVPSTTVTTTPTKTPPSNTSTGTTNSGTSAVTGAITAGTTIPGIITGTTTTPEKKPSTSTTVTTGTIETSGKVSNSGRTQRSALTDIIVTNGDPNIDVSRYHNNIANGFEVTTGNLAYELCDEDIELLCAIVSAESDKSYDDALAVISTILNRCERPNWIASHGRDPISQATAPNQYVVYQKGSYEKFMNGNAPETVVQAVKDALAGVRNHNYCSFRSNGTTSYSNNMITSTGNRYK